MCSKSLLFMLAVALSTAFLSVSNMAQAGAWTVPYGTTQVIKTYSVYSSEFTNVIQVNNNTSYVEKGQFVKLEFQPIVEVGATNDLTVGLSPSFQNITVVDGRGDVFNNAGLSSVDLYFRQKIWKDDFTVFSVQPLVKLYGIYDEEASPSLGQNQLDLELRGLIGRSFWVEEKWHYVNAELAYRKRLESPSDEIRADFTLGYRFFGKFVFMPQVFSIFAVDSSNAADRIVTNSTDFDLVKTQLSLVQEVSPNLAFQIGVFSHAYARNTGDGGGALVSVWTSF